MNVSIHAPVKEATSAGAGGADRDDISAVAAALNARPRKTLGWKTPAEALDELLSSVKKIAVATTV
jgi:hypothetical protein